MVWTLPSRASLAHSLAWICENQLRAEKNLSHSLEVGGTKSISAYRNDGTPATLEGVANDQELGTRALCCGARLIREAEAYTSLLLRGGQSLSVLKLHDPRLQLRVLHNGGRS